MVPPLPRAHGPLNMDGFEIKNAVFHYLAQEPDFQTSQPGQYYFNSNIRKLRVRLAEGWQTIGGNKYEGKHQIQAGVDNQTIKHDLGTRYLAAVNFLEEVPAPDDPSTSRQETYLVPGSVQWWVIDENTIGVKRYGPRPDATFYVAIMG